MQNSLPWQPVTDENAWDQFCCEHRFDEVIKWTERSLQEQNNDVEADQTIPQKVGQILKETNSDPYKTSQEIAGKSIEKMMKVHNSTEEDNSTILAMGRTMKIEQCCLNKFYLFTLDRDVQFLDSEIEKSEKGLLAGRIWINIFHAMALRYLKIS